MKLRTILPLLAIGAIGAAGWTWWNDAPAGANVAPPAPEAVPVDTATATRQDVPVTLTGLGTVQALNTVTVTARVDGQIQKIAFTEGQDVKEGDLLAQIDPRPFQAALDGAIAKKAQDVATLENAKLDLKRFQDLAQKDFATHQQLDTQNALVAQTEALIQGDQAAIDNARTQLDYTTIKAPLDGRTGFRLVDQGNIVHATDTAGIVMITQIHPISVVFTLPEDELQAVQHALAAGTVQATAIADDGKTVLDQGKLVLADNMIDQTTGTARFKAEFPNAGNTLWPGAFVNVQVLLQTRHNALTIPSVAVERGPDGLFAYVVKPDAKVEVRPIQVGFNTGAFAVVDTGLSPGDEVVTGGQYRLEPGSAVKPTRTQTSAVSPTQEKAAQ
ncbi:efflux RND transporter periplasmic adaptor subunit [Dongia sedimenti]|uniref:Efflux RND transporter periplasmic adaptor subunit n=1 Tax=Dongia sedimenti TaxID=3064282 RepID=A0ABU0YF99_9PROT|nr:efflux RND transporter periplasmic adaptor subunit [Rhodospirillaceae bacterium R-7]